MSASGSRPNRYAERTARFDAYRGGTSIETRIGQRIQITPGGCWAFEGVLDQYGKVDNKLVHRVVYEAMVGEIPEGWHVHHRCQNKGCANPAHLQAVSASQHIKGHGQQRLPGHLAAKLQGIAS